MTKRKTKAAVVPMPGDQSRGGVAERAVPFSLPKNSGGKEPAETAIAFLETLKIPELSLIHI